MTRMMFDSVNPTSIPADAEVVAGYVDGRYRWTDANWLMFPAALKVRVAVFATTDDGHFLDVETGDATPNQVPGWLLRRAAAGATFAGVYCNDSTWPEVVQACQIAGVPVPPRWAARPGIDQLRAGEVAVQYGYVGPYDISTIADHVAGLDPEGNLDMPLTDIDVQHVAATTVDGVHTLLDEFWNNQFTPAFAEIDQRLAALEGRQSAEVASAAASVAPNPAPAADSTEATPPAPPVDPTIGGGQA